MTIAALKFTETARARIVKAGGKCLTLDQLVMTAPTGTFSNYLFLQKILILYCSVLTFDLLIELFL